MKATLMPYFASILASDTLLALRQMPHAARRWLTGAPPTLILYIKPDDPYSYLLLQVIPEFQTRFNVRIEYRIFTETDPAMYPRQDLWQKHSIIDAQHLASLYNLSFPAQPCTPCRADTLATALDLADKAQDKGFLAFAQQSLATLWQGKPTSGIGRQREAQCLMDILHTNAAALRRQGHYAGAMIYCEGIWYWGIDRLDHLERKLNSMGANKQAPEVKYQRTFLPFCLHGEATRTASQPITLYWSARSPYSYIGLERAVQLAKHYGLALNIKPVLPMVMRGMAVPQTKKMYIFLDTKREAKKLGLNYGRVADPLGQAVERCYALLDYARSEGKQVEYLLSFARGVNSEGLRADTDKGLQRIVGRCGLDWQQASRRLNHTQWRTEVTQNQEDLLALGFWGVPTFGFKDHYFWGQDRITLLERQIKRTLDNDARKS